MASSLVVKLLSLWIVCLALCSHKANAVTCQDVTNDLSPCVPYIVNGGAVPGQCCTGVKTLFGQAQTTPDRQAVCSCIKNAIRNIPYNNNNLNLAAGLPRKCGVNLPYQISPNIDCSRVQ
ncbi:hypothetical protein K1719_044854 [Acacia pycnantha]|nr:hypothetical protein K1719_044854 [Acacia pycnantha]